VPAGSTTDETDALNEPDTTATSIRNSRPMAVIPRKKLQRQWERVQRRARLTARSRTYGELFDRIERYCQFVGFPRSGHTLVGALLNAHPDLLIAHESKAMRRVSEGMSRDQLYLSLIDTDRRFAEQGWRWQGYDYEVPGQWQARWRHLRVIGDKQGDLSSQQLLRHPGLLDKLRRVTGVPLRIIVITRNPFDNITRMAKREKRTLLGATDRYFKLTGAVELVERETDPTERLVYRYEDFVTDPTSSLERLTSFLGVDSPDDWLEACQKLVFASPPRARGEGDWSPALRALVDEQIAERPFLAGYRFDS
jgi:hypothetical protein